MRNSLKFGALLGVILGSWLLVGVEAQPGPFSAQIQRAIAGLTSGTIPFTGAVTINRPGIAVTSTDGWILANATLSTAAVPVQQSPRGRFRSHVWNTTAVAADNTDDWWIESVPVSGATPSSLFKLGSSRNGAAFTYPWVVDALSGNVGIGTTGPLGKLDVNSGNFLLTNDNVTHGITDYLPTTAFGKVSFYSNTAGGLEIIGASDTDSLGMRITAIIGSTDPTDTIPALTLTGAKKGTGILAAALGSAETVLQIDNYQTPIVTILGSGNVGIGTTAAGNKLDIIGGLGFGTNASGAGVLAISNTAPTIASGFGTTPTVPTTNGTAAFSVNVGTGGAASAGVLTMPASTTDWASCDVKNLTALAANRADQRTVVTASTTTALTVQNQTISTGAALAWTASDVLHFNCMGK